MRITSTLVFLLASVAALPAMAQVQEPSAEVDKNDIIVTAQKRSEKEVDVPITLSAVTGERMKQLGVSDLDELAFFHPGAQHPGTERQQSRHRHSRHHIGFRIGAAGGARHALL